MSRCGADVCPSSSQRQCLIARRDHRHVGARGTSAAAVRSRASASSSTTSTRMPVRSAAADRRPERPQPWATAKWPAGNAIRKTEPRPRPALRRAHLAALHLDQLPDERQAEAQSALGPAHGRLRLPETIEDERQELRGDPLAGVLDGNDDRRRPAARRGRARSPPAGVNLTAFDSTFQMICCIRSGIAANRRQAGLDRRPQADALRRGRRRDHVDRRQRRGDRDRPCRCRAAACR